MTLKTTKLRDAIVFALVVGATGSGVAFAQDTQQQPSPAAQQQTASDQDATELDTIVVTGTRIQSQTVTSSSPVTEIEQEAFKFTGATRAEDLVNQYPQMSPTFDAFTNNGALGYPTVDLRGLGPQRTLTLVNGLRLPPSPGEVPDISIIPSAAIKRVDLLTGGASAVYGSDAIAGVVNFILDDEFEGVSLSTGYSAYQHDNDNDYLQDLQEARGFDFPTGDSGFDGASRNVDLLVGSSFADGRGHAMAWGTWRKNDPLFQGQRDYSSCALSAAGTACGGSATNAAGNFYVFQFDADGDFVPGTGASLNPDGSGSFIDSYGAPYNFAPINYYQRPDERYTFGTALKYEINEHFRPYFDAMYINRRDAVQVAESGAFFTRLPAIDCDDPLIGTLCSDLDLDPSQPAEIYVAKRNVEGGPRLFENENSQWRVVAGLEGALDEAWSYNASFLHGQYSSDTIGTNDFLSDRIVDAILGCTGATAGCIPYQVFEPGGVTPEAAAALAGTALQKITTELNIVNAYVTGDTGIALPWVDNSIALVMGAEWRETQYDSTADSDSQAGNFAGAGGPVLPVSGKTKVNEIFLESAVPLISEGDVLKSLDLDLGYRLSDYDTGTASTWKVGLAANLADQFRIRTGFNRAIRAPNVNNLFATQQIALFGGSDPCAGPTPTFTPEQCLNTGVPLDRYGTIPENPADQQNQFIGGNPNLEPESAETFTFGVVYTPTSDMQFNVDYYDIELGDRIGTIGASTTLTFCGLTGDPFLCDKVNRNQDTFDIWRGNDPATAGFVENLTANFGELRFRGIDVGAVYRFDLGPGRLTTSLQGNYVLEQEFNPLPGVNEDAIYDCAGVINPSCQTPEWRHIANARYALNNFTFNLRWRYFGEIDYELENETDGSADKILCELRGDPNDPTNPFRFCRGDQKLGDENYIDLSGSAFLGEYTEITVGVNNVFDREPPTVGASLATNGNAAGGYDQAGRFIFGSVTFRF